MQHVCSPILFIAYTMDKFEQQEERLLERESSDDGEEIRQRNVEASGVRKYIPAIVLCLLVVSIVWNVVLVASIQTLSTQKSHISDFAGLKTNTPIPYKMHTPFMSPNRSISDPLWTTLDSHPILIALSQPYIASHGLAPSATCPQDPSKQLYQVKALHHIHCLKSIRMAYLDALEGRESMPPQHVAHCLDVLRQDVMCGADDTPTAFHGHGKKREGQEERMCRSWEGLVEWAGGEGRGGCFVGGG
ncbi:hypothetical protein HBI56_189990 [Parastagonospora nodorum]|uniref:Oxidase ustYa n=1 Tax=Phaeosphaeria nodorum (strain SN15 / ATCC MYA-4574 / FGSC 10173) TaxID=321614 RepID=A0A7U2I2Z1_PHANO|nr:hypothetical protein HBH56_144470 [Parastagonospora nodorum]QRD01401.1 hypothetical protein JI435_120730 [Parastagonospora nodorum SN15]KAH3927647.1 hypothetical protein HBH54_149660 [Parastagonospora nodorum]KAH3947811.1 hypothetical protein HBH53_109700 [Parastagonospora nodorum]KAH3960140.1 hypothetical protein HBH51_193520 [Parastagonospora nodorum]